MGAFPPSGEGVCGPARRRMRADLATATRQRAVRARSPHISPLRGQLLPRGRSLFRKI